MSDKSFIQTGFFCSCEGPKEPAFSTKIVSDQPWLTVLSQTSLKKRGDAQHWPQKEKPSADVAVSRMQSILKSPGYQELEDESQPPGTGETESEAIPFKDEELCCRLTALLSWLGKKPFNQLKGGVLITPDSSS